LKGIGAIIPVTTFGMPIDIRAWSSWQKETGIPVIIDAAGAFGGQSISKNISAIFSLHATKSFSTGEGGLIMTEHADLAKKLKKMSNFGIGAKAITQGTNAKLSEYHAAVGHASLNNFNAIAQKRRDLFDSYRKRIQENFGDVLSFQANTGVFAPSIFNVRFKNQTQRARAEKELAADLIETRHWYQPLIQHHPDLSGIETPVATPHAVELEKTVLGLPFFLGMTKQDHERIIQCLHRSIGSAIHK
jgi:dTDP-4-amino-4,6-dideoxygalactose transaminase